ncbi:GAF and ANTAR domain-containing protein [Kribbella sp. NPDC054772]
MNEVSASLSFPMDLDETLEVITAGAAEAVPNIDFASISITGKDGRIETLAPTDELAQRADDLQYELGEGPCLDAVFDRPVVQVDDIATDLRWPTYGPRAAKEIGIGSQLAFQFRADPHGRGGVNLYSVHPHALTAESRQLGAMFANLAAVALGWSRANTLAEELVTRTDIGEAIGIVMERYRLDPDRAFSFIVRTSQTSNTKLHDVAAGIIEDTTRRAE